MVKIVFLFSFFLFLNLQASYAVSDELFILTGDDYKAYSLEAEEALNSVNSVNSSNKSNMLGAMPIGAMQKLFSMNDSAKIVKYDDLLSLKSSNYLPDWVKKETLTEYGFTLDSSDSELSAYMLEEIISFDLNVLELLTDKGTIGTYNTQKNFLSHICPKSRKRTKSFNKNKGFSVGSAGGTISGTYTISGKVLYKEKLLCGAVYGASYKGVDLNISFNLDDSELNTIELAYAFNHNLLDINLFRFEFNWAVMAGPIPITGVHNVDLQFLIDAFLKVELDIDSSYIFDGELVVKLSCSKSDCKQTNSLSTISVKEAINSEALSSVSITLGIIPKLELISRNTISIFYILGISIDAELDLAFPITYYTFEGNNCDPNYKSNSKGTLLYVDAVLNGSISLHPALSTHRFFNIDFGPLYKKSIDIDEKLKELSIYDGEKNFVYKNIYFKAFKDDNFLKPIVVLNEYESDFSATLSLPNCLPNDLKSRGATYKIDWKEGYDVDIVKGGEEGVDVTHVFINDMYKLKPTFSLIKIGDINISEPDEVSFSYNGLSNGNWMNNDHTSSKFSRWRIPISGLKHPDGIKNSASINTPERSIVTFGEPVPMLMQEEIITK